MEPGLYILVLITALSAIGWLGGNFGKNAAAVSGGVHYVYFALWKGIGGLFGWTSGLVDIDLMTPIYISIAFIAFAAVVPQMRRAWMDPFKFDS